MLRSLTQPLRARHVHALGDHQLRLRALHVVPVGPRVSGGQHRGPPAAQPSRVSSSRSAVSASWMSSATSNVLGGAPRQRGEAAELVHPQAVGDALVVDRRERAAPAGDAGEACIARRRGLLGPLLQHDGLRSRDPVEPARRHRAVGRADPLADRHERVVPGEHVVQVELAPHLAEARVDVEVDAQAHALPSPPGRRRSRSRSAAAPRRPPRGRAQRGSSRASEPRRRATRPSGPRGRSAPSPRRDTGRSRDSSGVHGRPLASTHMSGSSRSSEQRRRSRGAGTRAGTAGRPRCALHCPGAARPSRRPGSCSSSSDH